MSEQTLTGNAPIASAERIFQHYDAATGTPEERFDAAMAKSLANAATEREAMGYLASAHVLEVEVEPCPTGNT